MAKTEFVQNDNNLAIAYYRFSSHAQNDASIDQQASDCFILKMSRAMHSVCGSCFITGFQTSQVSPNPCKNTTFWASFIYATRKNLRPG